MNRNSAPRYCIFRTDGIGDVILTLPMAEAIKKNNPDAHTTFCIQTYVKDIVQLSPWIDDIIDIGRRDIPSAADFVRRLKLHPFDAVLFAYPRPKLSYAAWRANIPVRIGSSGRWYSLFYNRPVHEHRSDARFHESIYNLHMLDELEIIYESNLTPKLPISDEMKNDARMLLHANGIDAAKPFIILHPGSGGSAKDWSADNFGKLGQQITGSFSDLSILITGTEQERHLTHKVKSIIGPSGFVLSQPVALKTLAALLSLSRCIVANSTGPLHIGAAVGIPVVALYPNKKVCNPRRWKPLGGQVYMFTPPLIESCARCRAESCGEHDRMERIEVGDVFAAVEQILSGTTRPVSA